jgi:mannitol-1-/sugar-/sorbitol-6-phosphatase
VRRFDCEAVLFDLDGVLVDSTRSVEQAWRTWAERHALDAARILESAHGRRAEEVVRLFAPHLDAEAEAEKLEQAEIEDASGVVRMEGADALLAVLPHESWAVVTSGTHALATARLRQTGLPLPRVLVCAEDVENGKPDPECYLKAVELLEVAPERCSVVEDAPAGVEAARAAGIAVIAVATTHSTSELSDADAVTANLSHVRLDVRSSAGNTTPRLQLLLEDRT